MAVRQGTSRTSSNDTFKNGVGLMERNSYVWSDLAGGSSGSFRRNKLEGLLMNNPTDTYYMLDFDPAKGQFYAEGINNGHKVYLGRPIKFEERNGFYSKA